MIKKPDNVENFEQLNSFIRDFYGNFGIDDLKPTGVRDAAPLVTELNPGQQVIAEAAGVPYIYYKSLAGVLYKKQLDVA